jgi:S1-C subfamily serine protease
MSVLTDLSSDLAAVVESAGKAVVRVEGRRHLAASGTVWSADGLVVTANHVLENDENIRVGLPDGESTDAALVGRDPTTDLALLRVSGKPGSVPEWTGADTLQAGHLALALARPGRNIRASLGIISALGEEWRTRAGGKVDRYIQADVPAYPGFSGGPLVDAAGTVTGLNTSGLLRGSLITIPPSTMKQVVGELLARGHISRGYLGVGLQPARLPSEIAKQLGQETGLLVISVEADSPADKAGLVLGDTIVTIGDSIIRRWDDLLYTLAKDLIGVDVVVKIVRAGQLKELTATVGEHP